MAKTYETQADITAENADEKLTALADGAGVKGADIAVCATTPVTKAHVDASIALGKSVNVTGTPTLFINGRTIGNISQVPADTLKAWWSLPRSSEVSRLRASALGLQPFARDFNRFEREPTSRSPKLVANSCSPKSHRWCKSRLATTCGVMMMSSSSSSFMRLLSVTAY